METERWFERIAAGDAGTPRAAAPARLKARIYSALVSRMAETALLRDLQDTKASGGRLCVFEELLAALPPATGAGSTNPCRICHARVLGERLDRAPIYWQGCPYAAFHRR